MDKIVFVSDELVYVMFLVLSVFYGFNTIVNAYDLV